MSNPIMRPPRVYKVNNKYIINKDNETTLINTKLDDINKIQKIICNVCRTHHREKPYKHDYRIEKIDKIDSKLIKFLGDDYTESGLSNFDIDKIMGEFGAFKMGYKGTIAVDELNKIKPTKKPFSCIVNTSTSKEKGVHWYALFIDAYGEKEIDLFDSFGRDIDDIGQNFESNLLYQLKKVVDKMKLDYMLKMKMNNLQWQPYKDDLGNLSVSCGFHSMVFLLKRMNGQTFEEASGLNKIDKNLTYKEKDIKDFKRDIIRKTFI